MQLPFRLSALTIACASLLPADPLHNIGNIFKPLATPAEKVADLSILTIAVCAVIFVIVAGLLAYTVIRFGYREGDARSEPPQVYGSNQAELAWTVVPVLIVFVLSMATARVTSGIQDQRIPVDALHITVTGHQFWWWREVLPTEHHENIALDPAGDIPTPAALVPVEYLATGRTGRDLRMPSEIKPWSAAFRGAVTGGIAMAGVATIFGVLSQGSVWYPINLLAAAAVPDLASASVEQLRQFSTLGFILGTIIHGLTSLLVGLLYAVMLPMFPNKAFWWAGISAPVLWSGLIGSTLTFVNPALSERIDWRWFIASQLAFGLSGGFVIARAQSISMRTHLPLHVRAGLDAQAAARPDEKK